MSNEFIEPERVLDGKRNWTDFKKRTHGKGRMLFRDGCLVYGEISLEDIARFEDETIV